MALSKIGDALQFMKQWNALTSAQMEILFSKRSPFATMVKKQADHWWTWMPWGKTKRERRRIGRRIRQERRREAKRIKYTIIGYKPLFAIIDDGTKLSPAMEAKVDEYLQKRLKETIWPQYYQGGFSVGHGKVRGDLQTPREGE